MLCLCDIVVNAQLSLQPFQVDACLCRGAGGMQLHTEELLVGKHPCALLSVALIRAVLPNHVVDTHHTI